jgi:hypothetical protein
LPQARRAVADGRELAKAPLVERAALSGSLTPGQARVAAATLREAQDVVPAQAQRHLEAALVDATAGLSTREASQAARQVLDAFAADCGEARAERAEREHLRAVRTRFFALTPDGAGSVRLSGSVPAADGDRLRRTLEARARAARAQGPDPLGDGHGGKSSWGQLMADALTALACQPAGSQGASTPQDALDPSPTAHRRAELVVTVGLEELRAGIPAGRLDAGEGALAVSELRRIACDTGVVPAVLGSGGAVLDLGRRTRTVGDGLRRLLEARDLGCVFPGCAASAAACEAHHLVPWWAGGHTVASNLVLACRWHHGMLEPLTRLGPDGRLPDDPSRWRALIGPDGLPVVIPPASVDRLRRPRRHERFAAPTHSCVTDPPQDGFEWAGRRDGSQGARGRPPEKGQGAAVPTAPAERQNTRAATPKPDGAMPPASARAPACAQAATDSFECDGLWTAA